jgi:iron complex outermembrane receptor protein
VGEWVGTEWQLTRRLWDRHTVVVGTEYRENLRQYQFAYDDVEPRVYSLDDDRTSRIIGVYAQGEVALLTNLVLNAGVRYDHYFESFGGTLNPRVGLIYNPWQGSAFKALYGQAFRAPNAYERFYNPEQDSMPELQPETIHTSELVYEQYFARDYRLSVSGFYYSVDDLISQTTTPAGDLVFENVAQAEARGVEFELEGKFDSGLLARASYAVQETEDDTGQELTSSPRHLAKLNLSVPLYRDNFFASLELQYHGAVRTLRGGRADDFVTANLTLFSRELVEGLEVSASIYNLFDTKYGYPGAEDHLQEVIRQDGRTFRVKLTYRF